MASDAPLPKAVVFDLDYTLWPYWVDTHIDPPLKRRNDALNEVVDRSGLKLGFFRDVPSILLELKDRGVPVAAASRTAAPAVARQALRELMIDQGDTVHTRPPRQTGRASERKNVTKAIRACEALTQTCLTSSRSTRAPKWRTFPTLPRHRGWNIAT